MSRFVAPIRRHDTAKGHTYRDATGAGVPGVTTILGQGMPKPALVNWAGNVTAEAAINQWDELAQLPPATRLKRLQKAKYEDKDLAAKRGTEVHKLAERLIEGKPVQVPDELAGHVQACAQFMDDFDVHFEYVEFSVAHYLHGWAGTGDFIATLSLPDASDVPAEWKPFLGKRIRILGDWKTNRSGIFPETALQLATYRSAEVMLTEDGEVPMPAVDACAAVHVRGDGYDLVPLVCGPDEYMTFRYAQQIAAFEKRSSDLVGAPIQPALGAHIRIVREETT